MESNEYLIFAKEMCIEAGKIMKKYFYQDNGASYKGDKTIVTLADKEINHILIEKVKEKFPDHSVDGEEEKFGKSKYVWVCDPVDGTAMYARHIPVAVFSLALVVDGVPEVGVVYDPFLDKLYSAIKGQGAYCNDEKITVNDYKLEDERSISHFDMWPAAVYNVIPMLNELYQKTYFIGVGSIIRACMCVATGDFTCCIFPGTKYVVLLKKELNGTTTYDAQVLTSKKEISEDEVKEVVKTETRSELPVTFDNPILFILLGVAVVAIVIIAIRIRSLSKKNAK